MKLTDKQKQVLAQAIDDGGELQLTGLDKSPIVNAQTKNLCHCLSSRGLGEVRGQLDQSYIGYRLTGEMVFQINDAGRKAVAQ